MQVIGFNFTKLSANRTENLTFPKVNIDIQFTNIEKQTVALLKDSEAIKLSFRHALNYEAPDEKKQNSREAEILFEGTLVLSTTKDESKELLKNWKNKDFTNTLSLSFI